jgi:transposase
VPAFSGLTSQNFTSKQIGHLGFVAGMIDELCITGIIDEALPQTRDHVLPHYAIIKAMLLNGLGFNERRLYIFSRFFSNLSTEQLFGSGVAPEHLNDDVLLRTLDRIFEYGSTGVSEPMIVKGIIENRLVNYKKIGNYSAVR